MESVAEATAQPRGRATSPRAQGRPQAADQLNSSRACVEVACQVRGRSAGVTLMYVYGAGAGMEVWACMHSMHTHVCREGSAHWAMCVHVAPAFPRVHTAVDFYRGHPGA